MEELWNIEGAAESSNEAYRIMKLRNVLNLRYLNVRILLHRPILTRLLDARSDLSIQAAELALLEQIGSNSISICMQSATSIITIVQTVLRVSERQSSLLGAWWFTLYYGKTCSRLESPSLTQLQYSMVH